MKLDSRIEQFKVIEGAEHISIVPAQFTVPGSRELIQSDPQTICTYLERYVWSRVGGDDIDKAHAHALKGARIVPRG